MKTSEQAKSMPLLEAIKCRIDKNQSPTLFEVASIMKEILQGLQMAHSKEIVHLNLSPNVIMTLDPEKLQDLVIINFC